VVETITGSLDHSERRWSPLRTAKASLGTQGANDSTAVRGGRGFLDDRRARLTRSTFAARQIEPSGRAVSIAGAQLVAYMRAAVQFWSVGGRMSCSYSAGSAAHAFVARGQSRCVFEVFARTGDHGTGQMAAEWSFSTRGTALGWRDELAFSRPCGERGEVLTVLLHSCPAMDASDEHTGN